MDSVPKGHLVPGVQGRRAYVDWARTLAPLVHNRCIDVGTGPVAIHARILSESSPRLSIVCTEIDRKSLEDAKRSQPENAQIIFHQVHEQSDVLMSVVPNNGQFDFVVCNPPFYDISQRDVIRTEMTESEGFFPGGEVAFCRLLMDQSLAFKDQLRFCTCLLGHKSSLNVLREYCWGLGAKAVVSAVFCPNKTRRWAIAWSFTLRLVTPKAERPLFVTVQDFKTVRDVLGGLEIRMTSVAENAYEAHAQRNTWSRRGRRGEPAAADLRFGINIRPWGEDRVRVFFDASEAGDSREELLGLVSHVRTKLK